MQDIEGLCCAMAMRSLAHRHVAASDGGHRFCRATGLDVLPFCVGAGDLTDAYWHVLVKHLSKLLTACR